MRPRVAARIVNAHADLDHDFAYILDGYSQPLAEVIADIQGEIEDWDDES